MEAPIQAAVEKSAATGAWRGRWASVFTNVQPITFMGACSAERARTRTALAGYIDASRAQAWRSRPQAMWQSLFLVGPICIAYCLLAFHMALPSMVAAVLAATGAPSLLGAGSAGLLPTSHTPFLVLLAGHSEHTDAAGPDMLRERSFHIARTLSAIVMVISALMALVRTVADMDVAFASAGRVMGMWDSMQRWEVAVQRHWEHASGTLAAQGSAVVLKDVSYSTPAGRRLVQGLSLSVQPVEALVITGPR